MNSIGIRVYNDGLRVVNNLYQFLSQTRPLKGYAQVARALNKPVVNKEILDVTPNFNRPLG